MDKQTNGYMDGWTDSLILLQCIPECYTNISPLLSMSATKLVPYFWSAGLTQKYFKKVRFLHVGCDENFLNVGWLWAFVPETEAKVIHLQAYSQ